MMLSPFWSRLYPPLPTSVEGDNLKQIKPFTDDFFTDSSMSEKQLIYKIVGKDQWATAQKKGVFEGAAIDLQDGYIHFSTAEQAEETAAKHFAGQDDLLLVAVETGPLGEALKWETSRGGALFPHLYATLDPAKVASVDPLPLGEDGVHVFP